MSLAADLNTLYRLTLAPLRGGTHAERLNHFYEAQADGYDAFRARLLQGRAELFRDLPVEPDAVWCDLGSGTASNVAYLGDRLRQLRRVYVVDLAKSLLKVARRRIAAEGWHNVIPIEADATTFVPPELPVDVVTCSYSLTMIPDWFRAIDQAYENLRPGGYFGAVDFYVSRKYPVRDGRRHRWATRMFWPAWFGMDNVYLSADHLPYLERRFETVLLEECDATIPYLPLARVPYYRFIGRKR